MEKKIALYRKKLGYTQSELAEKSGLSLRTVQRMENGSMPSGYTLKSLARALEVEPEDLIQNNPEDDFQQVKIVNISALSFILIPFGNIILPCILIYKSSQKSTKVIGIKIVDVQIVWTLTAAIVLAICPYLQLKFSIQMPLILIALLILALLNVYIIIRNSISLSSNGILGIQLNVSIL